MSLPILPPPQGKPKAKRPSNAMPRKAAEAKLRGTAETSELHQQAQVATVLTNHGHCFAAVPNGHVRSVWQNITGALEGVQAGMPDMLIFDPPPSLPHAVGVALEMKRLKGASRDVKKRQRKWLTKLAKRGWVPLVGYGASDAIVLLQALGYLEGCEVNEHRILHPRRLARVIALVERQAPTTDFLFGSAVGDDDEDEG